MKSPISTAIDQMIANGITHYLRSQGYQQQARSFFRHVNGIWQVVNVQASRSNTLHSGDFTINLSLTFSYFHEIWAGTAFPANPARAAQVLSWRIGRFLPPTQNEW